MDAEVFDNTDQRRFELDLPDGSIAAAYYRVDEEGRLGADPYRSPGRNSGVWASRRSLPTGAFQLMRRAGRKAVLRCQFMVRFLWPASRICRRRRRLTGAP